MHPPLPHACTGHTRAPSGKPLAVVLEPAKDLAEQVYKSIEQLKKYVHSPEVTQVLVMGGMDTRKIAKSIRAGCDVVVGTPGMMAAFVKVRTTAIHHPRGILQRVC